MCKTVKKTNFSKEIKENPLELQNDPYGGL